ncbi:NADH-ubiquinone oxidoreductase 9.5 kDa subunit [Daldinia vernicosa]|uniref:NADH-ubiquinone oxidoreductase 9.5 kDa subunit n=1 Tax=Daldinia vernicosa TaxID=114800 RepID=UPI0020086019|nr:NADH-ubiquinone oxidoreductase 9.5 kDa subunit [Daldinia vernicosa]KAI0853607.1 NADH-ubiquinone oxidoreductase 9.5 kDa subunit [Daldinia vernicosa]
MSAPTPAFFAGPLRYCRWAARERPAYFFSVIIGAVGPLMLATVPPAMKRLGYERSPPIPLTYPIPTGPRKTLTGYDD